MTEKLESEIPINDWGDLTLCVAALEDGINILETAPAYGVDAQSFKKTILAIRGLVADVRGRSGRVSQYIHHDGLSLLYDAEIFLDNPGEHTDLLIAELRAFVDAVFSLRYWVKEVGLSTEPLSINDLMAELEGLLSRFYVVGGGKIVIDLEEGLIANTDRSTLNNLLRNMCGNAYTNGISYTFKISGFKDGDNIKLVIEDDGLGIRKEWEESVFEEGFSQHRRGSGLGLGAIKERLRSIGGDIVCEGHGGIQERTPEGGAKFVITLPAA